MPLFRHLDDNAFLIFSRKYRHLYEASLLRVHDRFFSSGISYTSPQDVVRSIYDLIAERPDLVPDDADVGDGLPALVPAGRRRLRVSGSAKGATGDRVTRMAYGVYQRLVQTGWLEEEEYGLQVSVDMPMGALLVMQCLSSLQANPTHRFGGLVVIIKASLEMIESQAGKGSNKAGSDAAHALNTARQNADNFVKTLRAILSDLKRIRRAIMQADSLAERVDTYFDDFIKELVLKDFEAIHTTNHPFRYRDQIISTARRIENSAELLSTIAAGYLEVGLAGDKDSARNVARSDLIAIEETFETVETMFNRIGQFRRSLESRLRNTVRYAEQGDSNLAARTMNVVQRMDVLLSRHPGRYVEETVEIDVEPVRTLWSERQLAKPRQPRIPIRPRPITPRKRDPVYAFRKRLLAEYRERLNPPPERLHRFLERMVPPHVTVEARFMRLETVDDFLAFDAIRRLVRRDGLPPIISRDFKLWPAEDGEVHDSEWIECMNFVVRRVNETSAEERRAV